MIEIRRYRLMPAFFDTGHHFLVPSDESWEPEIRAQHEENRTAMIERLKYVHGEARLEQVVRNSIDLGSDAFSVLGWHNRLWLDIKHACVTCCYYSAATAAGALGERIANHLLRDLADDYATSDDRAIIAASRAPTFGRALGILTRWGLLEPNARQHFARLNQLRNALVHFDPNLYGELRERSLEIVRALRDAIDAQFGVLVTRRLIAGTPGLLFLKKEVEQEPFIQQYVLPLALHVSPNHTIEPHEPSGAWTIDSDHPTETALDTDEEFVRLMP